MKKVNKLLYCRGSPPVRWLLLDGSLPLTCQNYGNCVNMNMGELRALFFHNLCVLGSELPGNNIDRFLFANDTYGNSLGLALGAVIGPPSL